MVSMTQQSQTPPVSLTPQSLYDTVESDKFFVMASVVAYGYSDKNKGNGGTLH